jgi:hypothetical protein
MYESIARDPSQLSVARAALLLAFEWPPAKNNLPIGTDLVLQKYGLRPGVSADEALTGLTQEFKKGFPHATFARVKLKSGTAEVVRGTSAPLASYHGASTGATTYVLVRNRYAYTLTLRSDSRIAPGLSPLWEQIANKLRFRPS